MQKTFGPPKGEFDNRCISSRNVSAGDSAWRVRVAARGEGHSQTCGDLGMFVFGPTGPKGPSGRGDTPDANGAGIIVFAFWSKETTLIPTQRRDDSFCILVEGRFLFRATPCTP